MSTLLKSAQSHTPNTPDTGWVNTVRQTASQRLLGAHLPDSTNEDWKYVDTTHLDTLTINPQAPEAKSNLVDSYTQQANTLIILNGKIHPGSRDSVEAEFHIETIESETRTPSPEFKNTNTFTHLNNLLFTESIRVQIGSDLRDKPLHIVVINDAESNDVQAFQVEVIVNDNCHGDLGISYIAPTEKTGLENVTCSVEIGNNASLRWSDTRASSTMSRLTFLDARIGSNSEFHTHLLELGSELSRNEVTVTVNGENSHADINGLMILRDQHKCYNQVQLHHTVPGSTGSQMLKNILYDKSEAEFTGRAVVYPKAHQTDSTQSSNTLLLSNDARSISRPQLEIDADDVTCGHGATIGQLDEEHIFYLLSRGMSRTEAQSVLTFGFAEEVLEKNMSAQFRKTQESLAIPALKGR